MLYGVGGTSDIAPPKVWKIDPSSGDRTLLFDEEKADPTTRCANGSTLPGRKVVQMVPEGFSMDAAGNFYFAYINMPGRGVVKFDKAFAKCQFLTLVPDANQQTTMKTVVGGGYDSVQFIIRAFEIVDGKLYGISDTNLLEIDLGTGNRKLITNAKEMGGLGKARGRSRDNHFGPSAAAPLLAAVDPTTSSLASAGAGGTANPASPASFCCELSTTAL